MIRFFTLIPVKLPPRGSNIAHRPECLCVEKGSFVNCGTSKRHYAQKSEKDSQQKNMDKAAKESKQIPYLYEPSNRGLLTETVQQRFGIGKKKNPFSFLRFLKKNHDDRT